MESEASNIGTAGVPIFVLKSTSRRGRPRKVQKTSDNPLEGPSNLSTCITTNNNIFGDDLKKKVRW